MLSFFPMGGAGGGSIALDLAYGPTLPTIVVDRRIFVVTTQAVPNWHISTNQPTAPVSGDLWLQVAESNEVITISDMSPYFRIGIIAARQYSGGTWNQKDGYMGVAGLWKRLFMALPPIGEPLENYNWTQIDYVAQNGEAAMRFAVGDIKNIVIAGITYVSEIVGFGHDDLADGSGKARITFALKDCLNLTYRMNPTDTSIGGWGSSELRGSLQNNIKNQLENELRAVIKPVLKKASAGNQSSSITTYTDDLFLFAEIEILGAITYSRAGEGAQYTRFATSIARIKRVNGIASRWWQRSPYGTAATQFCAVSASGAVDSYFASSPQGIAFGFCV